MAKSFYEIREKDVEARLRTRTEKYLKGISYKFTSPGRRSVPDRLLIWPMDNHCFVECKAPGKTWTKAQAKQRDKLRKLGHKVYLVSNYEEVDRLISMLMLL